jgi:putative FmdB family regulatory protein
MPGYIYACRTCNKVFTQIRAVDERGAPATCPTCGTSTTKRLFTNPILIRKAKPPRRFSPDTGTLPRPGNYLGGTLENVRVVNCSTGIKLTNSRVWAKNVQLANNGIGLDMEGDSAWDGDGPVIE